MDDQGSEAGEDKPKLKSAELVPWLPPGTNTIKHFCNNWQWLGVDVIHKF